MEIHRFSDSTIDTLRSQLGDIRSMFAGNLPKLLNGRSCLCSKVADSTGRWWPGFASGRIFGTPNEWESGKQLGMRDGWKDSCREDKLTRRIYRLDHDRQPMTGRDLLARFESLGVAWERRVRSDASQGQFIHSIVLSLRDETIAPAVRCAVSRPASDRPSIEKLLAKETERLGRRLKNKPLFGDKRNPNPTAWLRRGETRTCVTSAPGPASLGRPLPHASVPSFNSGLQLGQPINDAAVGSLGVKVSRPPDLMTDVEGSPS
jgi:hypothetical protein